MKRETLKVGLKSDVYMKLKSDPVIEIDSKWFCDTLENLLIEDHQKLGIFSILRQF